MKVSSNVTLESTITHAPLYAEDARIEHGLLMSALGVLAFSGSLPATRVAAPELGAVNVGLGRAVVAAMLAAALLIARREPLPARRHLPSLAVIGATVVLGFPLLTAYAMQTVTASHASVLHALVPMITAIVGGLRTGERLPRAFWIASVVGTVIAVLSAATRTTSTPGAMDALLLVSVIVVAIGYAEGGRLSVELEGWRVICWALVLSAPFSVAAVAHEVATNGVPEASGVAWLGFAYTSVFSMLLGFFAWYRGLAEAGIGRASQVQLAQPILGLVWAALLLGEHVDAMTWLAAIAILVCVRAATRARIGGRAT